MRARCLDAWREWRRPIGFERQRFPSPTSQPPPDAASFSLTAAQMQSLMPSSKLWIILQQSVSSVQWSMYQPQLLRQHYVVGNAMQRHVNFPVVVCPLTSAVCFVHRVQCTLCDFQCRACTAQKCTWELAKLPLLGTSQSLCLPHPGDNLIIMMQTMMRFVMVLGMRKESFRV